MVNGATTVWERWDSYTREHGFNGAEGNQNASMNSFSHYAFGAITAWMFRDLAGIDTEGPGYRQIRIRPGVPSAVGASDVAPVSWVRAEYDSIRGRIRSAWRRTAHGLEFEVSLPANTVATVVLPARSARWVREGGRELARARGIGNVTEREDLVAMEVGSGNYHFEVHPGLP